MSEIYRRILSGLNLTTLSSSPAPSVLGDIQVNLASANLLYHNGISAQTVQTDTNTSSLQNKVIDASLNTLSNIVDANIKAAANVAYSKLNLTNSIVNADINSAAAIQYSKLNLANSVQLADQANLAANSLIGNTTGVAAIPTAVPVASANTPSSVVSRDASGNFSAGTVTANLTGNVTGNASGTAANVTGTVAIPNGGTGQVTQQAAINALTGTQSAGKYLRSDGTNSALSSIQVADVPTLNQNTTGTAANVTGIVAPANGGSGVANSSNLTWTAGNAVTLTTTGATNVTLPTTGTVATLAGTETLSNKTVSDALTLGEVATPLSPSAGFVKVYAKSDANLYTLNPSGVEQQVGSGSGGTKNYLSKYVPSTNAGQANPGNGNFELGTTAGWSLCNTALTSLVPSSLAAAGVAFDNTHGGTGASANLSFTYFGGSNVLAGTGSAALTSSTASVAGNMVISSAFNIDNEDMAKVLSVSFAYRAWSGTYNFSGTSSNSFALYIYDVTNGAWIQPAGVYNLTQSSGIGKCTATFQTTSNSTQYQIALVNINALSGAYTLHLDDFAVGPQVSVSAPAMSDWVAYTPTFTGFGTVSSSIIQSSRSGQNLNVYGVITAGTPTASIAAMTLGFNGSNNNVTTDSSVPSAYTVVGYWTSTSPALQGPVLAKNNSSSIAFGLSDASNIGYNLANGNSIVATSGAITLFFSVPISGWSSNSVMSSDTDTRVVAAQLQCSQAFTGTTSGAYPTSNFSISYDTHGALNGSTGAFVAPVTGYYDLTAYCNATFTSYTLLVYSMNASGSVFFGTGQTVGDRISGAELVYLKANDSLKVGLYSSANNSTNGAMRWSIARRSGPAVVAATETVAAIYTDTSSEAIPTSQATFTYGTKIKDTHGAYSGGTFTAPVSGTYLVNAAIYTNSVTLGTSQAVVIFIYKNGVRTISSESMGNGATGAIYTVKADGLVSLNAGDTVQVQTTCSVSTTAQATPGCNTFSICRIGN